ncbi:hypothetical protein ACFL6Z_08000 [Pseudomonadota bacterium]|uniref:hypothetical protein n=1 Tax=Shewanella sp. 10N.286.52.C2 TaxID=1880838 RepID=UPI000C820A05|nr:hypothetical protein [Shewanella sp. 10N.286.52.C2]PMG28114.1 hypothetical protein BCU94_03650 [Shewanella sp. 10N.286.52.C2]
MTEKNKWIISIALAFLGVVIPIALYFNSIPERIVVFEVVSKTDLVGALDGVDELEISIKEKQVKEAYLYLVKLTNTGTEPIMVSDYEKPIQIKFDGEILSVKAKEKIPTNLSLDYLVEGESVLVNPFLFNSEEEFSLEIVSSSKNYPSVASRIAGISEIKESYPSERSTIKLAITLTLSFILLVFYAKSFRQFFEKLKQKGVSEKLTLFILSMTCAFSSVLLAKTVIDIEAYRWTVYSSIVIPITLGMYWARLEFRYNKSIQPTADAAAD